MLCDVLLQSLNDEFLHDLRLVMGCVFFDVCIELQSMTGKASPRIRRRLHMRTVRIWGGKIEFMVRARRRFESSIAIVPGTLRIRWRSVAIRTFQVHHLTVGAAQPRFHMHSMIEPDCAGVFLSFA